MMTRATIRRPKITAMTRRMDKEDIVMECPYCGHKSENAVCDYCKAAIPQTDEKKGKKLPENDKEEQ